LLHNREDEMVGRPTSIFGTQHAIVHVVVVGIVRPYPKRCDNGHASALALMNENAFVLPADH